jgi:hypothetical protein
MFARVRPRADVVSAAPTQALVSRFAVSYGMVLNLLQGRSLAQVQTVVQASFGNYLRSLARSARGERHAAMVAELELLRSNMSPKALEAERALATMSKLRGRMQEERRALQALQQQLAQDPRAGSGSGDDGGHWLLEKQLPLAVLIRVAPGGATRGDAKEQPRGWGELPVDRAQGSSTEEEDADDVDGQDDDSDFGFQDAGLTRVEDEMAAAGEVVLSAAIVAFERVAAQDDSVVVGGGWEFTALGADNVWYRGSLDLIVGVGDAWLLPAGQLPSSPPSSSEAGAWLYRAGTARAAGGRASFPAAGRIANALVGVSEGDGLPAPADVEAATYLVEAQERITKLERQLLTMTQDVQLKKTIRRAATRINRVRTLEASIASLGKRLVEAVPAGWGEFQSALAVLRAAGAIVGEDPVGLTRLGEAAAAVRAQNELWVVRQRLLLRRNAPTCHAPEAHFARAGDRAAEWGARWAGAALAGGCRDCATERGVHQPAQRVRRLQALRRRRGRDGPACAAG